MRFLVLLHLLLHSLTEIRSKSRACLHHAVALHPKALASVKISAEVIQINAEVIRISAEIILATSALLKKSAPSIAVLWEKVRIFACSKTKNSCHEISRCPPFPILPAKAVLRHLHLWRVHLPSRMDAA